MGRTVLVTGAARQLAGRFLRRLVKEPDVERVIGVDAVPPDRLPGRAESFRFVRADLRQPSIVAVLAQHAVDTVVHLDVHATAGPHGGGRAAVKEINVLGTLQLLGACQKIPTLRRVVVASSTLVYGNSPRDPAVADETSRLAAPAGGGFAQDVVEIEGYLRGFARRCPDVAVTVLRLAHVLGPGAEGPLAAYFRLPVLPTVFGFDPRLQFVHEQDAVDVLCRAVRGQGRGALAPGTYNVAGDGVLLLSQAARRLGRPTVPVARPLTPWLGPGLRALGVHGLSGELFRTLTHGRVVRTDALRAATGGPLEYTTAEAFADFAAVHGPGLLPPALLGRAVERAEEALRRG
ncbi:NAD-dependent epimerase/dehydratase family protein [Streptomyces avicenniae]|uniref:NAD-dependent epimerase/dehydratase family protein n=1 Tax=Streptomyces avicenniae TaxID=500153 RepID=UPI00069C8AF0|nr:NAD-dependent epimerase/dehydratase family protein [Streptomyces avicenniae]